MTATGRGGGADAALGTAAAIERLRAGRATTVRASGVSMRPTVREGERVRIEPCPAGRLRAGDLVAFEDAGALVLHRALRVPGRGSALLEKGDGLPRARWVPAAWVLGRAVALGAASEVSFARGRAAALAPWLARLGRAHAAAHHRLDGLARRAPAVRLALQALDALHTRLLGLARAALAVS